MSLLKLVILMKSLKAKIIIVLIPVMFFIFIFMGVGGLEISNQSQQNESSEGADVQELPESVMRWEPIIKRLAAENGISEYKAYILAIIMVESRGEGNDPMQSSESAGQEAGAIKDPVISLAQGVSFYAALIRKGKIANVDIDAINQAYNFGGSYIDYVSKNGGKHKIELAENYSVTVVGPSLNFSGEKYSYVNAVSQKFNKPYLYYNAGNFFYSYLLRQYIVEGGTGGSSNGNGKYIIPVDNPVITDGFVDRINPVTGLPEKHKGLDFGQPSGSSIKASRAGEVVIAQYDGSPVSGYGKCTVIKHDDNTFALYAHQSDQSVKVGDKVKQGQIIGKVGSTGQSTGPHLHFEIRNELLGGQVDPAPILGIK